MKTNLLRIQIQLPYHYLKIVTKEKLYPLSVLRLFVSGIHTLALGGLKCNWGDIQSLVKDYPLPEVGTPPPQNLGMLD